MASVLLALGIGSCNKNDSPSGSCNPQTSLELLQHKWSIVSLNGEALRYVGKPGDYFIFETDGKHYDYHGGIYDTSSYSLSSGGGLLSIYPILNGIRSDSGFSLNVVALTSSSLILMGCPSSPVVCIADSLER